MAEKNSTDIYFYGLNTPKYKRENEKYYKDDTELGQDTELKFTLQMFKDTVKSEVQRLINKPYENIVVLAGAGASIVEGKNKGKTVSQLYDDIKDLLNKNKGKLYTFDYFREADCKI